MRGLSALSAVYALAMAGACEYSHDDILDVMPAAPLPAGTMKTNRGRKCVAQAKREAIKLRRRKAHRMHCRGSAS